MKYYIELTLLPSEEIPVYVLWEKLYPQLHLALVERKDAKDRVKIGISFPNYNTALNHLGCKLRLFSSVQCELEVLNLAQYLNRLSDYVHMTSIKKVPEKVNGYAYFKRLRPQINNERLARRRSKRKGVSAEEANAYFKDRREQCSRAPFIFMESQSSGKRFPLLIQRQDIDNANTADQYSTYGLSSKNTVPIF